MDRETLWRRRLIEFAQSGVTQAAFCRERGFGAKALRSWAKRLHFQNSASTQPSMSGSSAPGGAQEFLSPRAESEERAIPIRDFQDVLAARTRASWREEDKLALLNDALRSGMSLDRYARMNGLTPSMLYRWQRQFARQFAERPYDPLGSIPTFASVQIASRSSVHANGEADASPDALPASMTLSASTFEIVLRNGRIVRTSAQADLSTLTRLADALEAST